VQPYDRRASVRLESELAARPTPAPIRHLCYKYYVDTSIRNLDEQAYRAIRVRAVQEGRAVGELISEAIRGYLRRRPAKQGATSLRELRPEPYPKGNERLSSEIDAIAYGVRR
jgi:plasmid stability protein